MLPTRTQQQNCVGQARAPNCPQFDATIEQHSYPDILLCPVETELPEGAGRCSEWNFVGGWVLQQAAVGL
jgi:hypothetical protein